MIVLIAVSLPGLVSTGLPETVDCMVMLPLPVTVATILIDVVCALVNAPTVQFDLPIQAG